MISWSKQEKYLKRQIRSSNKLAMKKSLKRQIKSNSWSFKR
jgi:hypothetical protein